jgi:hypothetical protein
MGLLFDRLLMNEVEIGPPCSLVETPARNGGGFFYLGLPYSSKTSLVMGESVGTSTD